MQRKLLSLGITCSVLIGLISGCRKADVESLNETTNVTLSRASIATAVPNCTEDVINFENQGDFTFTSIGGASFLKTIKSRNGFGPILINSYNPNTLDQSHWTYKGPQSPAAVLFNSATAKPTDEDFDLFSETLGMICVIQNFDPTYFPAPNDADEDGAWATFDFSQSGNITAQSITIIDQEKSENESLIVKLYKDASKTTLLHTASYASGVGQGNVYVLSLNNTPNVGFIEVIFNGSIGIDDIAFCQSQLPSPPSSACSYTQGYWKTHGPNPKGNNNNAWPTSIMTAGMKLGTVTYNANQLLAILNQPVKGNGLISLAHQLIAANLNIANGANPATVQSYIDQANKLIGSKKVPPIGTASLKMSAVSYLVDKLTQYNEGTLPGGPKHCD